MTTPHSAIRNAQSTYTYRLTQAERKILRKPKAIKPSAWAEKYRHVVRGPMPGPWRNRLTPYLVGIMDAAAFSSVETTILCKIAQSGGTDAGANFIGYALDRAPGDVLLIYPTEKTAKEISQDRLIPMIEQSPGLRDYLTGSDDDTAALRIRLQHAIIYMSWATSADRLASKPIRYLVFDETDKYPEEACKRETDPITLGEKRVTTFQRMGKAKIWKLSSPTMESGFIWQAFTKEAQVVFDFWVRCPFCNTLQLMVFERIKWPEDERDPEKIENEKLAWYECDHCHAKWDDDLRDNAVRNGQWCARPHDWNEGNSENWKEQKEPGRELFSYLRKHRPKKIGFHVPAWITTFISLSRSASAFLKGQKNKTLLKDFQNGFAAEPWRIYTVERTEDAILALRDDRPRGLVPGGGVVAGLTGAIDTHKAYFRFEIRAWGWGLTQDSWQVLEGNAPTFKALEEIMFRNTYKDTDGLDYIVQFTVIDAFGVFEGPMRTREVYEWCRQHRGRVLPLKGIQKMNQPYRFGRLEYYPGTKKAIPGGLQLFEINTTYYKSALSNKLEIASGDPGSWRLHSETNRQWALEMTAEYIDEKTGFWVCPQGKENHAWDVSIYNLACTDMRGIKQWVQKKPALRVEEKKPSTWLPEQKSGWFK